MHDALRVRGRQRARDLSRHVQCSIHVERATCNLVPQAVARDELEHQEHRAVGQLAEVGGARDVRVLDIAGGHRFALEARHHLGHTGQLAAQHLHGEPLAHQHVLGGIHLAHAALTNERVDAVTVSE